MNLMERLLTVFKTFIHCKYIVYLCLIFGKLGLSQVKGNFNHYDYLSNSSCRNAHKEARVLKSQFSS